MILEVIECFNKYIYKSDWHVCWTHQQVRCPVVFRQHLQLLMIVKNNLLWCFLIRHGLTSLESTCCIIYFGLVLVDFCFFSSPPSSSRPLPKFHVHVPLLCVEFLYFSPSSNEGNFPSIENKHGWDSTSASKMTLHHLLSYLTQTACPIG